ncbi:MAG: CBS domain-containing protein [Amphritea sp.]
MQAADIMTTDVITVSLTTEIREIAELLLKHRISAVPVVDAEQRVLGIVSEGDLLRRVENDTEQRHSWWMELLVFNTHDPDTYLKTHGRKAHEVMTRDIISIREETPLYEIAQLLEKHHIKRVPVTRDGHLVGLVSRANLLHGLTAKGSGTGPSAPADDRTIRASLQHELSEEIGLMAGRINVVVNDGVVQLWGVVYSETEKHAAQVAAESIPGVKSVENYLGKIPPWLTSA